MFKHILMPTDGSEHSERAIVRGIELAKLCNSRVTGIHVVPDYHLMIAYEGAFDPVTEEKIEEEARQRAASFLDFVKKTAAASDVPCDTVVATSDHPYDAIVNIANERGCDLIVMTLRYRKGLVKLIMGNEATRVLHRASIPVLVFRGIMSADHPDRGKAVPAEAVKA
ncbi:MAG: universal stress protein [Betaproteobacteria bacterium]|nr:universal stress protein [Betaproteobacteria bacterium]